jgi:hypothetical protein
MQYNGLPADHEKYRLIGEYRNELQVEIAEQLEATHAYSVYVINSQAGKKKAVFKSDAFDKLIDRLGIKNWPVTAAGHYSTDDKRAFEPMAKLYPELEPLRQARKSINSLSRFEINVSEDNRNRFSVCPFGSITRRNQPKASQCVLLLPKWLRNLMRPDEGMVLIQIDIKSVEPALAAAFSGDDYGLRLYESGADQYLEFAKATEAAPPNATVNTHSTIRDLYKTAVLSIQYGVSAQTLAQNLGIPLWSAERMLACHKRVYAKYWQWAEAQIEYARQNGQHRLVGR